MEQNCKKTVYRGLIEKGIRKRDETYVLSEERTEQKLDDGKKEISHHQEIRIQSYIFQGQ